MEKIDPALLQRLDALASKLGITIQYLWKVLVKQGITEGIIDFVFGIFFLVLAVLVSKYLASTFKETKFTKTHDKYGDRIPAVEVTGTKWQQWTDGQCAVIGVISIVLLLGSLIAGLVFVYNGFIDFVNPEFFALSTLGNLLK